MGHEDKIYTRGTVDWRSKNSQVLDNFVDPPYLPHFPFSYFYFLLFFLTSSSFKSLFSRSQIFTVKPNSNGYNNSLCLNSQ